MLSILEQSLKDKAYIDNLPPKQRRKFDAVVNYYKRQLEYEAKCAACKDY